MANKRMTKFEKACNIAIEDMKNRGYNASPGRGILEGDKKHFHFYGGYLKLDEQEGDIFYLSGLAAPVNGKGMFSINYEIDVKKKGIVSFEDNEITFEKRHETGTKEIKEVHIGLPVDEEMWKRPKEKAKLIDDGNGAQSDDSQ